jgi:hypothetical protein
VSIDVKFYELSQFIASPLHFSTTNSSMFSNMLQENVTIINGNEMQSSLIDLIETHNDEDVHNYNYQPTFLYEDQSDDNDDHPFRQKRKIINEIYEQEHRKYRSALMEKVLQMSELCQLRELEKMMNK